MLEIQGLIKFFDTGFVLRLFILILLFSLFPLGEIYLLVNASDFLNIYVLTSVVMLLSFTGFVIGYLKVRGILKYIKREITNGTYPEHEFHALIGSFAASVLLIFPGVASFIAGLLIMMPVLTAKTGRFLSGRSSHKMKEVYEYLKLYDL